MVYVVNGYGGLTVYQLLSDPETKELYLELKLDTDPENSGQNQFLDIQLYERKLMLAGKDRIHLDIYVLDSNPDKGLYAY